jgi:hypothetical protein
MLVAVVAAALATSACVGGGSPPAPTPTGRPAPDLAAFLRLPVATPSVCPANQHGSASGRHSPWAGRVDVSVFVGDRAKPAAVRRLGALLRAEPDVERVYVESRAQAYAEYQRLYTCSAAVPADAVPASYRLVLAHVTQAQRDALVRAVKVLPGVAAVSCDPTDPCLLAAAR